MPPLINIAWSLFLLGGVEIAADAPAADVPNVIQEADVIALSDIVARTNKLNSDFYEREKAIAATLGSAGNSCVTAYEGVAFGPFSAVVLLAGPMEISYQMKNHDDEIISLTEVTKTFGVARKLLEGTRTAYANLAPNCQDSVPLMSYQQEMTTITQDIDNFINGVEARIKP